MSSESRDALLVKADRVASHLRSAASYVRGEQLPGWFDARFLKEASWVIVDLLALAHSPRHHRRTTMAETMIREVVLPDLHLHGNLPVVVRRCYYNGSDVVPTTDPADGLALRYRYACDPPEWYRLTERDMARCSGDDFRALAKLEAAHV
jgi:hypothetical protein